MALYPMKKKIIPVHKSKNKFSNYRPTPGLLTVTRLWNALPEVTVPSVNSFKNRLDRHWITEEFLYNYKAALPGSRRAFQGKLKIWPPRPPPTVRKNVK